MENKKSITELSVKERIILIANEIRISKDGKNDFAKYSYFQPDTILALLNPLLLKYNLHLNFSLEQVQEHYKATLIISDFKSPENEKYIFDIDKAIVKGANPSQNSGATLTYAKRYSLMNAFNIADNSDDFDSNEMTVKNIDKIKKELQNFKNLGELKTYWLLLPKEIQTNEEILKLKNELKIKIQKGNQNANFDLEK